MVKSTKTYKPFTLIFKREFSTEREAISYEKKLKQCRIEKEKIINEFENNKNK